MLTLYPSPGFFFSLLLITISKTPFLYVAFVVFGITSQGRFSFLWYFLCGESTFISIASFVAFKSMSSFSTPGISTVIATSSSPSIISVNGSRSSEINCSPSGDLMGLFPKSSILGFPSGL